MEAGESAQSVQPIIDAEPDSAQHQGDTTNNPGVPETLPTESTDQLVLDDYDDDSEEWRPRGPATSTVAGSRAKPKPKPQPQPQNEPQPEPEPKNKPKTKPKPKH